MGHIITNWAKRQQTGGGVAKAVLLCLADSAKDYERGVVVMTLAQIGEVIEFSKRAIIENLKTLEEKQLISRDKSKKSDGTNNPNKYKILCPAELFEQGAPDAPSEHQGAGDALPKHEETPQGAPDAPPLVRQMHLEQGAPDAPSTVLKEEELLRKERDINAREIFVDEMAQAELEENIFWIQRQKGLKSKKNFPETEWSNLLADLSVEGIAGEGFRKFYEWVGNLDWVETVSPKLLRGQIEKYLKRDELARKKQTGANQNAITQRNQYQPNDAGTRNTQRIDNTDAAIAELLRQGRSEQNLLGERDVIG